MDEQQYLDLISRVRRTGDIRRGRNGHVTMSVFGVSMRYSLRDNTLPLFTTKRTFFRGIVEELLWMLRGSTDAGELSAKNVNIWDGHSSREHLDSVGLDHYEVGDVGPLYGFQMRHAGEEYKGKDYKDHKGVDQLAALIEGLKNDPFSRRHVMSFWAPKDLDKMALNPCHVLSQFYVDEKGNLSCQLYQRSADIGLGLPFNVASYSLLTHIIAKATGYKAKEFIHAIGDAHIYAPHSSALGEQTMREPLPFPKVRIEKEIATIEDIENLQYEDFVLEGYKHHGPIKMHMMV